MRGDKRVTEAACVVCRQAIVAVQHWLLYPGETPRAGRGPQGRTWEDFHCSHCGLRYAHLPAAPSTPPEGRRDE